MGGTNIENSIAGLGMINRTQWYWSVQKLVSTAILIFWQWIAYSDYNFCYWFYSYPLVQTSGNKKLISYHLNEIKLLKKWKN